MKTPDEIKNGLECCIGDTDTQECEECPYRDDECCTYIVKRDAYMRIQQLEERIDLMLIQMRGDCGTCKHRDDNSPCDECLFDGDRPGWEYEGLPEVKRDGES